MISDDSMKEMIRSLNSQRRKIFDEVYIWCKSTCKYQSLLTKKKVNPLIVFTSRGAGVGKSYLINTIFQTLARTFNLYCDTSEKVKVLNKTSTGVAPANINGTTINFALGIPTTKGKDIPKLRDKVRCKLRLMYSELEEVIIDEIYMVSNISYIRFIAGFMWNTWCKSRYFFCRTNFYSFRRFESIAHCLGKKTFAPFHNDLLNLCHSWKNFSYFALTEVME